MDLEDLGPRKGAKSLLKCSEQMKQLMEAASAGEDEVMGSSAGQD